VRRQGGFAVACDSVQRLPHRTVLSAMQQHSLRRFAGFWQGFGLAKTILVLAAQNGWLSG
jgi:hypothetical protein